MFLRGGVDIPMHTMDPLKISENLAFLTPCVYQGVRSVRFSEVFRGIKRKHWGKKGEIS